VVCSAGPARVAQVIREALARGADRAIHVEDDGLASADAFATSDALAAAMKDENFDLVLTGCSPTTRAFAQVGVILAEKLGRPHATIIMEVQADGGTVASSASSRRLVQWVAMPLPAVLTIQSGINQLRYATLKGIMAAKKKEIQKVTSRLRERRRASRRSSASTCPRRARRPRSSAGRRRKPPRSWCASSARKSRGDRVILVIAEQRDGKLNRATWERSSGHSSSRNDGRADHRARGRGRRLCRGAESGVPRR
jgi:electron transfer flavoprotein alpha/beta subunit